MESCKRGTRLVDYIKQLQIIKLDSDKAAVEGFRLMHLHKITAIPVVDAKKHLVTTLSSSDARVITENSLANIALPVTEFLKESYGTIRSPVTVSMNHTVGEVMNKLLESKVHRVWVEEAGEVTGVVSMSNILSLWKK